MSAHEKIDHELTTFLSALRPAIKIGVITNAGPASRQHVSDRFGLDRLVDLIVVSAEEGISKPHPTIYLTAARRLGVPPEQCIFVDDTERNVDGARAVGMAAVHFTNTDELIASITTLLDPPATP